HSICVRHVGGEGKSAGSQGAHTLCHALQFVFSARHEAQGDTWFGVGDGQAFAEAAAGSGDEDAPRIVAIHDKKLRVARSAAVIINILSSMSAFELLTYASADGSSSRGEPS